MAASNTVVNVFTDTYGFNSDSFLQLAIALKKIAKSLTTNQTGALAENVVHVKNFVKIQLFNDLQVPHSCDSICNKWLEIYCDIELYV